MRAFETIICTWAEQLARANHSDVGVLAALRLLVLRCHEVAVELAQLVADFYQHLRVHVVLHWSGHLCTRRHWHRATRWQLATHHRPDGLLELCRLHETLQSIRPLEKTHLTQNHLGS